MIEAINEASAKGDTENVVWNWGRAHSYADCLRSCQVITREEASSLQHLAITARMASSTQTMPSLLAGVLIFTGQVATAIRMYSAYNQSGTDLTEFGPEDVMFLSDTLVSFEFLGEHIVAGNAEKVVAYCDTIAQALRTYVGQPTFVRNPAVNLPAAISHLGGIKAAYVQLLAS